MPLPELDVARLQRWCATRVPDHALHQVRVECDVAPRHVTIVEVRRPSDDVGEWTRFPVARLRWVNSQGEWSLLWRDRNERFHTYEQAPPAPTVQPLLDEIERDPTALFWG